MLARLTSCVVRVPADRLLYLSGACRCVCSRRLCHRRLPRNPLRPGKSEHCYTLPVAMNASPTEWVLWAKPPYRLLQAIALHCTASTFLPRLTCPIFLSSLAITGWQAPPANC